MTAHYFTGKPCCRGHIALRKVSDRSCVECKRLWVEENRSKQRRSNVKWARRNRAKMAVQSARWAKANRAKVNKTKAAYRAKLRAAGRKVV